MTLYVSDSANLRITVRKPKTHYTPKGDVSHVTDRIVAAFQRGGVPAWAEDIVTDKLDWRGQDDSFSRSIRTGVYDTVEQQNQHGWTDDERLEVERFLDSHMAGNNYIRVDPPRLEAPWPAIDKLSVHGRRTVEVVADKLLETASDIGIDPNHVVLYVAQEEGNVPGWDARLVNLLREKIARAENVAEPDEELVEA